MPDVLCTGISLVEVRPGYATPLSIILVSLRNQSRTIVNRKVNGGPLRLRAQSLAAMAPKVFLFDGHELEGFTGGEETVRPLLDSYFERSTGGVGSC